MKNNYLNKSFAGLIVTALMVMFAQTSKANGCVYQQEFGPSQTFVTGGSAAQTFTTCESGSLSYVSLFMQSTNDTPFGTYLNIYRADQPNKVIHTQQVVVPASYQKPYTKIWMTKELQVAKGMEYIIEVEVPANRDVMFYHSDNNIYNEGQFLLNKELTSGDLAFEFGINKKSFFEISSGDSRSDMELWTPELPDHYGCVATQRYHNGSTAMTAAVAQSFTACRSGLLSDILINAQFTPMTQSPPGNITVIVYDHNGTMVGHTVYDATADEETYMNIPMDDVLVNEGEEYTIRLTISSNQNITLYTVDDEQYFAGSLMINNQQVDANLCFYAVVSPLEIEEEEGEEETEEEFAVSLQVDPPKEVNELRHTIYPNPFSSNFRLTVDTESKEPAIISVYNFMGNKIYTAEVEDISQVQDLLIAPDGELSNGYYTLRIEYGDNIILDTVIKQ